jgi:hypothetical protein
MPKAARSGRTAARAQVVFLRGVNNMLIAQPVEITTEGVQPRGTPTALIRAPLTGLR